MLVGARSLIRRYAVVFALIGIVLLGAVLRLYHLSTVPTELIVDEIDLYNSAHSIATTGHDVDGTLLPFLYSQFTRNPPIYAIAGYASTLVLGKNAFGLRFPAVLFGLAAILLLYGIVYELTRRRSIALLAAFFQAVQPIFVQFSRIAWEPAAELPFLLAAFYVLLRGFRAGSGDEAKTQAVPFGHLALGALLMALTCYTYMAGWFYGIVLAGAIVLLNYRRFTKRRSALHLLGAVAIWICASAPALWMLFFNPLTTSKTQRISTFSNGVSLNALHVFIVNYFTHFRWSYLVTSGDPQSGTTWRYLNGFGALFWWTVVLTAIGFVWGLEYVRARWARMWVWIWIAAYPLGGALTNEAVPNAPRTLAGAPVFCVLGALGLRTLLDWIASIAPPHGRRFARLVISGAFAVCAAVSIALFSRFYFTDYVHRNSNAWDSGTRALFAAVRARSASYRRVCFSVHPAWYGIDSYVRFYLDDVAVRKIDNIDDQACFLPGTLLVTDSEHPARRGGFTQLAKILERRRGAVCRTRRPA